MNEQDRKVHYTHYLSYTLQEQIVGLFLLLAPVALVVLFLVSSETYHLFEERLKFHLFLHNASGVSTETPVQISGIEVGRVTGIDITSDNRIHLTLRVRKRFAGLLRSDSQASLGKLAMLGHAVIEVSPGSPGQRELRDGAEIPIVESKSLDEIIAEVGPVVQEVKETVAHVATLAQAVRPQQVAGMVEDMGVAVHNLRVVSDQVVQTELKRVSALVEGLGRTVAGAEKLVQGLDPTVGNAAAISGELRRTAAELPATAKEVQRMVVQLNAIIAALSGELRDFPQLMSQMKLLMEETDRLVEGAQRVWPLSSAVVPPAQRTLAPPRPSD